MSKTFVGTLRTRHEIDKEPYEDIAIIAPTYKILQQSTLPKFFEINDDLRKFYNKVDSIISIPRGKGIIQNVYIRSTDNPLSLEGMTLKFAWLDEAGQMKPEAFLFMQARVAIKKGTIFITTTPYNMGWLYLDFFKPWKDGKDGFQDFECFTWASVDNPYFPPEEFERVKKTLEPKVFNRRYLGEFTKMEGLVYDLQDRQIIAPKVIQPVYTICGVDFGWNNPSALIVVVLDKDGVYYEVEEYYQSEKTTDELIEKAKLLREKWGINKFYCDTAEPDRIESFNRAGLYAEEANKDIKAGISKVTQIIRENRFYIFSYCKRTLHEFETYHYPPEDEEIDPKKRDLPIKENDHALDALRYAIHTHEPQSAIEEVYIPPSIKLN